MDKNDNVIDLKFLLAQTIGTQPQYIQLVKNMKERVFANSSSLIETGLLKNNNIKINYWLEFPQFDSKKPNEFVIRSQPKLLSVPEHMTNIGKAFRYFTKKFIHNPHLGLFNISIFPVHPKYMHSIIILNIQEHENGH